MSNELIFILTALIDLTFILLVFRLGKMGLVASMIINMALVSTFGAKIINIFGLTTNSGNVFYASIFLASNILLEHYGKKESLKAVWTGFCALILFVVMSQFMVISVGSPDIAAVNNSIQTLFSQVPRIAFASAFAYIAAQSLNVWVFDIMHRKHGKDFLWLRNIVSTSSAQFVDSILFFVIAFYGVLPNSDLFQTISIGFVLKIFIAILSTPFIYWSYNFRPPEVLEHADETQEMGNDLALDVKPPVSIDSSQVKIVRVLSIFVGGVGVLIAGGWVFQIPFLMDPTSSFSPMMFSSAGAFFFTGLIIYSIIEFLDDKKDYASILLFVSPLVIALLMGTAFLSSSFTSSIGVDSFSPEVTSKVSNNFILGKPSIVSLFNFTFVVLLAILTLLNWKSLRLALKVFGAVILATGCLALVGYILKISALYYRIPNFSEAMSVYSAILFILVGVSFYLLGRSKPKVS